MTTQGFIAYHGVAKGSARDLFKTGFSGPRRYPHGIHLGGLEQARMRAGGGVVVKALSTKVESFRFHHASSQAA